MTCILSHNGKELPFLIQKLIKNIAKLCHVAQKVPLKELTPNPSGRKKRTQFVYGLIALLSEIIRYTDLMTLKVGIPVEHNFRDCTLNYLSIRSSLPIWTVKRVFKQLVDAGYIKVSEQIVEWRNSALYCSVTIKEVSYKLLEELGVKPEEIDAYQHKKYKQAMIKPLQKGLKIADKIIKKVTKIIQKPKEQDIKQRMFEEAMRIHEKYPQLSITEIYKLIEEKRNKSPPK